MPDDKPSAELLELTTKIVAAPAHEGPATVRYLKAPSRPGPH